MTYEINVEGGKYTFTNNNGIVNILRNGEEWRNESGDKALLCLLQKVERYEKALEEIKHYGSVGSNAYHKIAINALEG